MTDFLLKEEVGGIEDGVFDRPPVLTAGETTELVSSALLPYGQCLAETQIFVAAMSGNAVASGIISVVSSDTPQIFLEISDCQ